MRSQLKIVQGQPWVTIIINFLSISRECYIPSFKAIRLLVLEKKLFIIHGHGGHLGSGESDQMYKPLVSLCQKAAYDFFYTGTVVSGAKFFKNNDRRQMNKATILNTLEATSKTNQKAKRAVFFHQMAARLSLITCTKGKGQQKAATR